MTRATRDPDAITSYKGLRCTQSERSAWMVFDRKQAQYARERDARRQARGPLVWRVLRALVLFVVAVVVLTARSSVGLAVAMSALILFAVRGKRARR